MNEDLNDLSLIQYRAICILVSGGSIEEAAQVADCTVGNIKKWKTRPDFKRAMQQAILKVYEASLSELVLGASRAAKELNAIIANPEGSDRVKVTAISTLFSNANVAKQLILDERLSALEEALNGHTESD